MFYRPCLQNAASGWLHVDPKLEKGQLLTFVDMTSSSIFFNVTVFFLSSLVNYPSFMSISWLVLEFWQFPEIGKKLLNAPKHHGYSINRFWAIKGKPTSGVKLLPPPPLPLSHLPRLKPVFYCFYLEQHYQNKVLSIRSNKCAIYVPEMNL